MTVPGYIRASAWALIAGAIAHQAFYIAGMLVVADSRLIYWNMVLGFHLLSTLLLSVAALGLRERYGAQVGAAGRNVLAFGMAVSLLGYTALAEFTPLGNALWALDGPLGLLPFWGTAFLLASLAAFGRIAAKAGVLPQSLGFHLLAGLWLSLVLVMDSVAASPAWETGSPALLTFFGWAGSILTTLALVRLGLLLQSGPDREPAPA